MVRWTVVRRFTLATLAAALTACSEPTAPDPSAAASTFLFGEIKPGLVECPTDVTESGSALLGVAGGTVIAGGHLLIVPANALPELGLSLITLTAPASKYVEIEVRVNGEPHFLFNLPVTVVVDYSRCSRINIDRAPLRVWYIDSETKEFLADMGGIDDKLLRTVTFFTDHFSGYAIAQ
jgi:hypothetical protein